MVIRRIDAACRELVISVFENAYATEYEPGRWIVKTSVNAAGPVGRGDSEGDAWHRAARYLAETGRIWTLDYK